MSDFPAAYSDSVLDHLDVLIRKYGVSQALDPFAGSGRIHELDVRAVGLEIEPEWASLHPRTIAGDVLAPPFRPQSFHALITSPTYGNRLADHHVARDGSYRRTYRHALGHALHPHNSGQLQWGGAYRSFHREAYAALDVVLTDGAVIMLNVSDHIRRGEQVAVAVWHMAAWIDLGWQLLEQVDIPTPRFRAGSNNQARVTTEQIYVLERA